MVRRFGALIEIEVLKSIVNACRNCTGALTSGHGPQVRDRERNLVGRYEVRLLQQRAENAEEESREAMRAARGAEVEAKNAEGEREETGKKVEVLSTANRELEMQLEGERAHMKTLLGHLQQVRETNRFQGAELQVCVCVCVCVCLGLAAGAPYLHKTQTHKHTHSRTHTHTHTLTHTLTHTHTHTHTDRDYHIG